MQIPILNGIYADNKGEYRTSYPRNCIPIPKKQGISNGYLKPSEGIVFFGAGEGFDRGGIVWRSEMYRVLGSKLCKVTEAGSIDILGDVGGSVEPVTLNYSFDYLAVASDNKLYYWNGTVLTQVTDVDLGSVVSFIWVDGYFMTTDGTSLVVTELNDPFSVNPLKYGSAEINPDPIKLVLKVANEPKAVGRYTIESFYNKGGEYFPFQRINGALIERGAVGTQSACVFPIQGIVGIVFLGGGLNESPSVWFGLNATAEKIATREIDTILQTYTELQLSKAVVESRIDKTQSLVYIHLPDQTLVYDAKASQETQESVWFTLDSGDTSKQTYKARYFTYAYNKWFSGDVTSNRIGYFVDNISTHYGGQITWEFNTLIVYNKGSSAIFHEMELIGLPGRVTLGADPVIWTSYSLDGETWSVERPRSVGKKGATLTRMNWLGMGTLMNSVGRIQKFRGTSLSHASIAALEARLEPLN